MSKRPLHPRIAPPCAVFALSRTAKAVQTVLLGLTLGLTGLTACAESLAEEEHGDVSTLPATLVEGDMATPAGLPPQLRG